MAIIGKKRQNNRNSTPKRPNAPNMVPMSTQVGTNRSQLEGKKSLARLVTMITKRSNHMPTLTKRLRMNISGMLVRTFLNQKSCGVMTLQLTMIQYAHEY